MLQQPPQRKEFLKLLSLKMRELVLSMVTGRHELVIRGHWQTDSSIPNCCLQNDAVADEDSQFSRYLKILKSLANQFEVCRGCQIHRNWSYIYRSTSSSLSNLCISKWMLLVSWEYFEERSNKRRKQLFLVLGGQKVYFFLAAYSPKMKCQTKTKTKNWLTQFFLLSFP